MIMFFVGVFAEFSVRARLIQWDDPVRTYTTIRQALPLFDAGTFAWLVVILLDVIVAAAFYVLLRTTDLFSAWLMVSLRLLYVAIKGAALVGLALARDVVASASTTNSVEAYAHQVMSFLKVHHLGFTVALFFIGLHLVVLAHLLHQAQLAPRLLVWLLLAGGIGYSLNSLASLFAPDSSLTSTIIIAVFVLPMTVAELSVGLWLWIKRDTLPWPL